jgi:cyclopropane-fatty-acyl-phospholipid synthase
VGTRPRANFSRHRLSPPPGQGNGHRRPGPALDDVAAGADISAGAREQETPAADPAGRRRAGRSAAATIAPLLDALFATEVPVQFRFWDGSTVGPAGGAGAVIVRSPDALRRLLWAPGDLGLSRAYVVGDLDFDGDLFTVLRAMQEGSQAHRRLGARGLGAAVEVAGRMGALGRPLPPPAEEVRPRGWRHSKRRDARAISHHYDVGNDFYRLVLGSSLTYSCARFADDTTTLEEAQAGKHELVSAKLGLPERRGARLLDVGCGWGSMALHAASRHGAAVVGITISQAQAELARQRVVAAGLADQVEIRLQDYRDLRGEEFDAISSIGMFEHVGAARAQEYFETLRPLLRPGGRLLNHAISSIGGSKLGGRSFLARYVFPDGELLDVGEVVLAMERAGFEVRDVESLREHYARTLRHWVANLDEQWDEAVALVGTARARVWRLYMAASAVGFDDGGVAIHQVLGVVPDSRGRAAMPAVRSWN